MILTLLYGLLSVLLAAAAGDLARRHRRPLRLGTHRIATRNRPMPVLLRTAPSGGTLSRPERTTALVAPLAVPGSALVIVDAGGKPSRVVELHDVALARGWSHGELVLAVGRPSASERAAWPVGRNLAGWELHLVTLDGAAIRCYGAPGTSLADDLRRLQDELRRSQLLRAS